MQIKEAPNEKNHKKKKNETPISNMNYEVLYIELYGLLSFPKVLT